MLLAAHLDAPEAWLTLRPNAPVETLTPHTPPTKGALYEVTFWPEAANATFAYGVNQNIWQHAQQRPSHLKMGLAAKPWWDLESILHPTVKRKLLSPSFIQTLRREGLALLERGTSTNGMKDRFRYGKGGDGAGDGQGILCGLGRRPESHGTVGGVLPGARRDGNLAG